MALTDAPPPPSVATNIDDTGRRHVECRIDTPGDGPLTTAGANAVAAAAHQALGQRIPLVIHFAANGPAAEEGLQVTFALGQAARALTACSGIVPTIAVLTGEAVAGPALLLGLVDIVVVVDGAHALVSGPAGVKGYTGVDVTRTDLGGASSLATDAGLTAAGFASVETAAEFVAGLLEVLPASNDEPPPTIETADPSDRLTPEAGEVIPASATGAYDVRKVIETVVDDAWFLELRERYAPNLVTGFASFGGQPVGIVANQPMSIAGTLDINASQKGARFVAFCDAFNLPLVTLVDTSGFYPGKDLEWRGMIRYGAQMAFAYARATVPRVNVTLRKSYGGAYIVMDSKKMGNDFVFAWPSAEIAVMGAKGAVEILHRNAGEAERAELEEAYEERLLNPYIAAQRGSVDAVINPEDTRREVTSALRVLASKRERLPRRRHDNTPL